MLEIRTAEIQEIRVTRTAEGKPEKLVGYASVFNQQSLDLGGFREIIAPGAFADTLASQEDIRALVSHDPDKLMGRTANGTLRCTEDDKGLRVENDIPDTSYARDLIALVDRGDIRGMSFGFNVPAGGDSWSRAAEGGQLVRTVSKASICEVSFVASPAYTGTSLSLRVAPSAVDYAMSQRPTGAGHRLRIAKII